MPTTCSSTCQDKPNALCLAISCHCAISPQVYMPKDMWLINQEGTSGTCYFGASLKAYERLVAVYGYTLVALDTTGVNAFFIHESAANGQKVFSHEQVTTCLQAQARAVIAAFARNRSVADSDQKCCICMPTGVEQHTVQSIVGCHPWVLPKQFMAAHWREC